MSLRVFEGFAVVLQGRAALVRDQLGLRARRLTDNEISLGNVEQKTNHLVELEFGPGYTFGRSALRAAGSGGTVTEGRRGRSINLSCVTLPP